MTDEMVHKARPSTLSRLKRLLMSAFDPRAYAHALKVVNYYNYMHVQERRKITLGAAPRISPVATFANGQNITLGDRVHIGAHCYIWAGPGKGRIVMGDDCLLGPNVMMTAANYRFRDGHPVTEQAMTEADIILGRDVWLATSVVVLPGTRLGDGCVVGAGAVVRGEFPPMSIIAGNPGKIVGTREIKNTSASD